MYLADPDVVASTLLSLPSLSSEFLAGERQCALAVAQCPTIGPRRFLEVVERLSELGMSWQEVWKLKTSQLSAVFGQPSVVAAFTEHRREYQVEKLVEELATKQIEWVMVHEGRYPALLKQIYDPPPVIFFRGNLAPVDSLPVAVVGTRNVTAYGRIATEQLVRGLVRHGCAIVSGFMYGVDAVAHQTALANGGYTVGVFGFGFDHMYPPEHQSLAEEVLAKGGALVSEYLPSQIPIQSNFPARNRIVAGLSLGVLVTEAAKESGSKITAQFALENGREVYIVSGAITSKYAEGTKDLANNGAKLVTKAEDIVEEFGWGKKQFEAGGGSAETTNEEFHELILAQASDTAELRVLEVLLDNEQAVDDLAQAVSAPVSELIARLSVLEIRGIVTHDEGKWSISGSSLTDAVQ